MHIQISARLQEYIKHWASRPSSYDFSRSFCTNNVPFIDIFSKPLSPERHACQIKTFLFLVSRR